MPWFATNAWTGMPMNHAVQYEDYCSDLHKARRDRLHRSDLTTGQTIFKTFGRVSVTYTVTQEIGDWQPGCEYLVKYTSDGGTIMWFHTEYKTRELRHYLNDTFTVYPR